MRLIRRFRAPSPIRNRTLEPICNALCHAVAALTWKHMTRSALVRLLIQLPGDSTQNAMLRCTVPRRSADGTRRRQNIEVIAFIAGDPPLGGSQGVKVREATMTVSIILAAKGREVVSIDPTQRLPPP